MDLLPETHAFARVDRQTRESRLSRAPLPFLSLPPPPPAASSSVPAAAFFSRLRLNRVIYCIYL